MLQVETMRTRMEKMVRRIQDAISEAVEQIDGRGLRQDSWTRAEGGGGISRVLQDGNIFEKAGVNVSTVVGTLSSEAARALKIGGQETQDSPPRSMQPA